MNLKLDPQLAENRDQFELLLTQIRTFRFHTRRQLDFMNYC
jgi:hypothetical protein